MLLDHANCRRRTAVLCAHYRRRAGAMSRTSLQSESSGRLVPGKAERTRRQTRIPRYDGTGVRVGILDTGVAKDHPALKGRVESQQDFTGDGIGDQHGHGSQSAGLVASQDAAYPGIAPDAKLVDLKMINYFGSSDPQMAR